MYIRERLVRMRDQLRMLVFHINVADPSVYDINESYLASQRFKIQFNFFIFGIRYS